MRRLLPPLPLLPLLLALPLLALDCGDTVEPPAPALTSIAIAPDLDTIESLGATASFTATTLDQDGDPFTGVTLTWISGTPAVATVAGTGIATAAANGTTILTASSGAVQGTATLVVHQKATALAIATQPAGGTAGTVLGTQPVVHLRDAGGAPVGHDNASTVTASVMGATLTGTTTVTVVAGVATFTNLAITEAGNHTISFASGALTAVTSVPVSVTNDAEVLISSEPTEEDIGDVAFDGTNFVLVWKTDSAGGHRVRRMSTNGALVGDATLITGAQGDPPRIACDGTRCLVAWAHNDFAGSWWVFGRFLKADGTLDGDAFTIVPEVTSGVIGAPNLTFGGGTYMVDYVTGPSHDDPALARFARTISTTGAVGAEIPVVTSVAEGFSSLAFGGGVFVLGYRTAAGVIGARTITPAGVVSGEIGVAAAGDYEPAVPVAFDGTNFLVVFSRKNTGTGATDISTMGRFVTPAGATAGTEFAIDAADGEPRATGILAQPAGNGRIVVSLVQESPTAGTVTMVTRFVTLAAGAVTVSGATTVGALANGKVALGGVFATTNDVMLIKLLRGTPGTNPENPLDGWTNVDLYARVVPLPPLP